MKDFGVTLTSLLLSCPLLYGKLAVLEMMVKPDFGKSGVDSQEEDYYQVEGHVDCGRGLRGEEGEDNNDDDCDG